MTTEFNKGFIPGPVGTMTKTEVREHLKRWPRLKCSNGDCPEGEFRGLPSDVNTPCGFCAVREQGGRIVQTQGMLNAMDPADFWPHWDQLED